MRRLPSLFLFALWFAGCKTQLPGGFGVALTIRADSSITSDALKTVTRVEFSASGDESDLSHYDFSRMAFTQRVETVTYRPRMASRRITILVVARNAAGDAIGSGSTAAIALTPGQVVSATVTLSTGGPPPPDLAGETPPDLSGADLFGEDLATTSGPDLAGVDIACAMQTEDCFNGSDDNCDGLADCADPTCMPVAECVPMTSPMGTLVEQADSCPADYNAFSVALNQGINQGTSCTGCTCTPSYVCHANVYELSACPSTVSKMFQSEQTYCQSNGALGIGFTSGKVRIDAVTFQNAACAGTGSPSPPPLAWTSRKRFCQTNKMGGGCTGSNVCVPKAVKHCVTLSGNVACPANYNPEGAGPGTPWHSGFSEGRTCSSCSSCGSPSGGNCTNVSARFYTMKDCVNSVTDEILLPNMSHCAQGSFQSVRLTNTGTAPTCSGASSSNVSGAATETGQTTLCCR